MLILFGALIAFLLWELVSVNRELRRDAERKRHVPTATGDTANATLEPERLAASAVPKHD